MSDSLNEYYLDFNDDLFISSLAIVHKDFQRILFQIGNSLNLLDFMSQWRNKYFERKCKLDECQSWDL